jgi:hypothetical protein
MNLFWKKLLAKYVIYIEIIGYGFVILFVAGLIALSKIKAEDEYVNLNGHYEINSFLLTFDEPHYLLELQADSSSVVTEGIPLIRVTSDKQFIADHSILENMRTQREAAQNVADYRLAEKILSIIVGIERNKYPNIATTVIKTPIAGTFYLFDNEIHNIPAGKVIGGVFDFVTSKGKVTEFPPDKRMKKKLEPGQKATITLKLGITEQVVLDARLATINDEEAIFEIVSYEKEASRKIAVFLGSVQENSMINASVSVLVGEKSWMQLIWR